MNYSISTRNRQQMRKLVCEPLESRQLMATDMVHHNFMMPEDSDMSGNVNALDALVVINQLNSRVMRDSSDLVAALDVDADGSLSPLDALTVINYINRSVGGEEVLVSGVNIERRIERLEEAMDSDLLPPNIDVSMAKQIREVLRAGGFPEMGDRMLNGVLLRENFGSAEPGADDVQIVIEDLNLDSDNTTAIERGRDIDLTFIADVLQGIDPNSGIDFSMLDGLARNSFATVNDPTDDNGNGSFEDRQIAAPILNFIEAELRKQLKVGNEAAINVAVFKSSGEINSGTWIYFTEEGIGVSGNWIYTTGKPESLNLFRSNVDIEKRIYVQYPGSGFIYYSWLPDEPVGYYFSPIGNASAFQSYFDSVPGSEKSTIAGFTSYFGNLGLFDGIAPIEDQASALFAIDKSI